MTVTAVYKDGNTLTMTITAEFDASPERVWQLWADPRKLERWWGPPSYPATFTDFDFQPGGRVNYHMTGPTGDQPRGWWEILELDPPNSIVFLDGFADDNGDPNPDLPATTDRVSFEEVSEGKTQMTFVTFFSDAESMAKVLAMGMEEGLREAVGQIDAILDEDKVGSR
jgi:uncharacterized protein YndB with AHSA1/START domain